MFWCADRVILGKSGSLPDGSSSPLPDTPAEDLRIAGAPMIDLIRDVIGRGASIKVIASGCSMAPFIKDGDILTLSPLPARAPECGDVVAFKFPQTDRMMIHRVIEVHRVRYLVKGDYLSGPDCLIAKSDILGLLSRVERAGSRVRIGIGPGKALISYLSARSVLFPLLSLAYRIRRQFQAV